ncbi:NAD(P)/FAD-dependent oxidoreductase [Roseibium sp.]|uniref:NAD(P)/FAD-dependent oxidoreductase n=1 Tax=Roseibium sp. TaxID=1936156 RepID=UPI003B514C88
MLDVLVIGAGPAGLFAADQLAAAGLRVQIIDRMPSPARKFLMAGRGGLNITHSEPPDAFVGRYREAAPFLAPMIEIFPPEALIDWCHGLGQETFVGSSGRVFPVAMKASPLLRALLRRLEGRGVTLQSRISLAGLTGANTAIVQNENGETSEITARAILLALGGASWPKLGSTAAWVPLLEKHGVQVNPFQPANCGFEIAWSPFLKDKFSGSPLKRIGLILAGHRVLGEAILSEKGLEGGAVYALSAEIRDTISRLGSAEFEIDLRPAMPAEQLADKLARPRGKQTWSTFLKKTLKLKPSEIALLHENGPLPADPSSLADRIKRVTLTSAAPYPIDRAISSAGGIALDEVDEAMMLRKMPGVFAAGEILDWEAPTGGYLLQACFATAHCAAAGIETYLKTATLDQKP